MVDLTELGVLELVWLAGLSLRLWLRLMGKLATLIARYSSAPLLTVGNHPIELLEKIHSLPAAEGCKGTEHGRGA